MADHGKALFREYRSTWHWALRWVATFGAPPATLPTLDIAETIGHRWNQFCGFNGLARVGVTAGNSECIKKPGATARGGFYFGIVKVALTSTEVTAVYSRLHSYFRAVGAPSGC